MADERFRKVEAIFHQALRVAPDDRKRYVSAVTAGDASLADEACALLEADATADGALGTATLQPNDWSGVLRNLADRAEADDDECALASDAIAGFRILRRIGAGRMGVVYEAEQASPRRLVAVKVLRPNVRWSEAADHLRREGEILARLRHPGIASIHGVGTFAGPRGIQGYLVMELIEGEPLHRSECTGSLSIRQKLELIADIADAVGHAHRHGVVHCDLKPANILVVTDGAARPCPKIVDFGIARMASERPDGLRDERRRRGALIGTPAYMSPEQAGAGVEHLDERSDVYALGVVAFELLTGRLPHDVHDLSPSDAANAIRRRAPLRISMIDPSLTGDVDAIIAKALRRDRRRRHRTAAALADELRRACARLSP